MLANNFYKMLNKNGLKKYFCESTASILKKTSLHLHHKDVLKGKMVGFAGYDMPVQYTGIIDEHDHCRQNASIFDVSHMGQVKYLLEYNH